MDDRRAPRWGRIARAAAWILSEADLPVVLSTDRAEARTIGGVHTEFYLGAENYRNNLFRLGWKEADLEWPGSDALFDAIVAWGDVGTVRERIDGLFSAGADQVVLNLISKDRSMPYVESSGRWLA